MVQRYEPDVSEFLGPDDDGEWVLYSDYTKALDALRKCHKSLCAYIDRDNSGSDPTSKYDAIGAANAAFWVIDDGPS